MKHLSAAYSLFIPIIVSLLINSQLIAQCPTGNLTLLTQAEVDAFPTTYLGCTSLPADLTIGPSTDITNLNALSSLTQIGQSLIISGNDALTDMSGLDGLVSIYRHIYVTNNAVLLTIDLEDIAGSIIGDFHIDGNAALTTLAAPINLISIGNFARIFNNPNLANLTGLENLTTVGRILTISNTLEDVFPDFSNLTVVGGGIAIGNNLNVTTLNFQNVGGTFYDSFVVQNNNALVSLAAPQTVTSIGALFITNNPNLINLTGLSNLTTVASYFRIANTLEDNFPNFSNLTSVGTDIVISSNQNLTSINLQNVAGSLGTDFSVTNNPVLVSLAAPINLNTIGNNLTISNNTNLSQISGLENVTSIGLRLVISHTLEDTLPDFDNLTSVGRLIAIGNNPNVKYLNFQNVSGTLSQSFQIGNNPSLTHVDAPINLTAVGEDLTFGLNPNLATITGLRNISSIGQYLYIDRNGITGALDFSSVTSVGRFIYFTGNPNVTSIDIHNVGGTVGIGPLYTNANGIAITNNATLTTLAAPEPLTSVDAWISINQNPNLSTFTGFDNLTNVSGGLYLGAILASTFPDMLNLITIGGNLEITENDGISTLNWINNLTSIGGILRIQNNSALSYCSINAVCSFLGGSGLRAIGGNTGCCLNEPVLTNACNNVSSGTAEICDGLDNDCDGLIDEDFDLDQDGFTSCAGDCDDNDPNSYPGSIEICDNKDNNCDGSIDEGFDLDQDGYTSCAGDCDDNDPNSFPGNAEVCDGVDNNCDGTVDENDIPEIISLTLPIDPESLGNAIIATATFSDGNDQDSHTVQWDWGDGSTTNVSVQDVDQNGNAVSTTHTYSSTGVYIVSLTITDACGDQVSETSSSYVVIYDPGEGFVTGGGWIKSPAGSYVASPTLTGKANFGFVSKYQQGQSVPTGNTNFHLNVASFKFKSTSYDWLVIAGPNAKFKGTGKVNNQGNYGFMLTGVDGDINGGSGIDKFRIKIWDKNNGNGLVYDNKMGSSETGYDAQTLGGGKIQIHKNGPNRLAAHLSGAGTQFGEFSAVPNPFSREVRLGFALLEESSVRIRIFNTQGAVVRMMDLSTLTEGEHQIIWDGKGEQGRLLADGVYVARLEAGSKQALLRLMLMR